MTDENLFYEYLEDKVSFISQEAAKLRTIYFPLCGPTPNHIKSSITPFLSGDIKIDKYRYLTKPVSLEDLRHDVRNFFFSIKGKGICSIADPGSSQVHSKVEIGQLWHKVTRTYNHYGLDVEVLNFVPVSDEHIELMQVKVKNVVQETLTMTPTTSIPVFARALANKHDHEHVTSLLNRIEQLEYGISVAPPMIFDEEGHKISQTAYFVLGFTNQSEAPLGTFPTIDSFFGEGGTMHLPEAVVYHLSPKILTKDDLCGKEAVGALRFCDATLRPGEEIEYFVVMGIAGTKQDIASIFKKFDSPKKFNDAFMQNKAHWAKVAGSVSFEAADQRFNSWMRWVVIQPVLRRIFGCSFLPEHDYGKGGRGWRDIWQDLLSLILIEPETIHNQLINNFSGVRIDGSNATIIGSKDGEFISDRNNIPRVWMDHGIWPLVTTLFYIHQTGDFEILLANNTYFRDAHLSRSFERDFSWDPAYGNQLKTKASEIYQGTIIEHLLVQNLVQFFNVGEHNCIRLENADWNDGLDMAFERGESVAFTSFYGQNLLAMADLLEELSKQKNIRNVRLAKEIVCLLDSIGETPVNYNEPRAKQNLLFNQYFPSVQPEVSGEQTELAIGDVISDLRKKGEWIFNHICKHEKISENGNVWFNGYYDNQGRRVEGRNNGHVRMTLTGQVYLLMSRLAEERDIAGVVKSVNKYLKDITLGGIRLNTDFGVDHYLDLGRAFGFAYGTKENGAFFNHMTVMYAYALYKNNLAREGYDVIDSIYKMCANARISKIYPGIPEYFDSKGRGRYHFLTGSASWMVLTLLTEVFGVRGRFGDLVIEPKLVKEQFSQNKTAFVSCQFAGKRLNITYVNEHERDYKEYGIDKVLINGQSADFVKLSKGEALLERKTLSQHLHNINITIILL